MTPLSRSGSPVPTTPSRRLPIAWPGGCGGRGPRAGAGCSVAEVGDDAAGSVGIAGADDSVALHAHRVAGGMQGLRADDDRVEPEALVGGVPRAVVDTAEQSQQV